MKRVRRLISEALWFFFGPTIVGVLLVSLALTITFTTCGPHFERKACTTAFDIDRECARLQTDFAAWRKR